MGYSHYYHQKRDYTQEEWKQLQADVSTLLKYVEHRAGILIRNWNGSDKATISRDVINFNGAGDDSCENFIIERERKTCEHTGQKGYHYCKTNRKPYDTVVTALLCYLTSVSETHGATSDGSGTDFVQGLELARQALPRYSNQLDIPRDVMEEDRWCGPWPSLYSSTHEFHFCVDGRAYILGPGGKSYRFYSHSEAARWAVSHIEKTITVESSWAGSSKEGGKGLFQASGSFDEKRQNALAEQQTAVMQHMLAKATGDRALAPPAFIRPGELPAMSNEKPIYNLADLLNLQDA